MEEGNKEEGEGEKKTHIRNEMIKAGLFKYYSLLCLPASAGARRNHNLQRNGGQASHP